MRRVPRVCALHLLQISRIMPFRVYLTESIFHVRSGSMISQKRYGWNRLFHKFSSGHFFRTIPFGIMFQIYFFRNPVFHNYLFGKYVPQKCILAEFLRPAKMGTTVHSYVPYLTEREDLILWI